MSILLNNGNVQRYQKNESFLQKNTRWGRRWFAVLLASLLVWGAAWVTRAPLVADDAAEELSRFRIDSVIRVEEKDQLTEIKTSTIFSDGLIFDFIGDNGEIIIYRPETENFLLIDPIHRVQTRLTQAEVTEHYDTVEAHWKEKNDKFCNFMLDPTFDFSENETGELLFQSKWIDYKIKTQPFNEPEMGRMYFHFIDSYARLNIFLNPGAVTAFARIRINKYLEQNPCFPEKIQITVYPKGKWYFAKTVNIESEHKLVRRLSEADQSRVLRALHFEKQFRKVTIGQYHQTVAQ